MLNPTDDDDGGDEDSEARSIDESNHRSFDASHHIASLPGAEVLGLGQDFRCRIQSPLSSVIITSSTLYTPVLFSGGSPAFSFFLVARLLVSRSLDHTFPTDHWPPSADGPKNEKGPLDPEEARSQRYKHLVDVMQVAQLRSASLAAAALRIRLLVMMVRMVAEMEVELMRVRLMIILGMIRSVHID